MGRNFGQKIIDFIRYGANSFVYSQKLKEAITEYNKDKNANILVENDEVNNNKSAIYFSSNSLYYPMNLYKFNQKIKKKNFFEFYKTRYDFASQHVFLRDLRYLWYQYGINDIYNTPEKVLNLLKYLTDGREIYAFGGSSGGFGAILFGTLLNAKCIVVSDPQIDFQLMLKTQYDKKQYAEHYENEIFKKVLKKRLKYANIKPLIEKSKSKIYVVSSLASWVDLPQYELIKNCNNIRFLFNNSDRHGYFGSTLFPDIIKLNEQQLDLIFSNKFYSSPEEVKKIISAQIHMVGERESNSST